MTVKGSTGTNRTPISATRPLRRSTSSTRATRAPVNRSHRFAPQRAANDERQTGPDECADIDEQNADTEPPGETGSDTDDVLGDRVKSRDRSR